MGAYQGYWQYKSTLNASYLFTASILGYMRDLSFSYITCAAVAVIVYWPSNPRHGIIYILLYIYYFYRQAPRSAPLPLPHRYQAFVPLYAPITSLCPPIRPYYQPLSPYTPLLPAFVPLDAQGCDLA